jgi:hypothetical protein
LVFFVLLFCGIYKDTEHERQLRGEGESMTNTAQAELIRTEDAVTRYFSMISVEGVDTVQLLRRLGSGSGCFDALSSYTVQVPLLVKDLDFQIPHSDYAGGGDYAGEDGPYEEDDTLKQYAITVHGIKGASYGIEAYEAGRAAEELENAAREGNLVFVRQRTPDFTSGMEIFIRRLEDFLRPAGGFLNTVKVLIF